MKRIRLDSENLTLCFSINENEAPKYLYFGNKVNSNYNFKKYYDKQHDICGVSLSRDIFSTFGSFEHHEYSHIFLNPNGGYSNSFKYVKCVDTKKNIQGMPSGQNEDRTICFVFIDEEAKIQLNIYYSVYYKSNVFSCYSKVINIGRENVQILKASSLSFRLNETDLTVVTYNGSWAHERTRSETKLTQGLLTNSSINGSSSHLHNPFTMMLDKKKHAYGFNLIYGGNHKTTYEAGFVDRMNVIVGINDFLFNWKLAPRNEFVTPEAIFSYGENENELTHNLHEFVTNNLIQERYRNVLRPVVFNNWEGTYFTFTGEKIEAIAKEAAALGGELFVLDDGWFSNRNSDTSSLGDWWSNKEKTGGGLTALSKKVKSLGMKFGIWMEPEMISPDSDLYRSHPEYAMEIPGRKPTLWRNELMLDLTQDEVREFVFKTICNIIDEAQADYVKWDYNRQMTEIYGKSFPTSEYFHRYMLSFYNIMERVLAKYPNVLFEGCAGGGGRFDLGMLRYFSQVWTSDDTCPRERITIQDGTLTTYPQSCITAHVSSSPIHTTKKTASLEDRFNVSCSMNLGYELDPTSLTKEEKEAIKEQIKFYKAHRELIQNGRTYRLGYKDVIKGVLTVNEKEAMLFVYMLKDGKFELRLPDAFVDSKTYELFGKKVLGKDLNNKILTNKDLPTLRVNKDFTVEIGTQVILIK